MWRATRDTAAGSLVLANNPDMLKLMRNLGFSIKAYPDDPEFKLVTRAA